MAHTGRSIVYASDMVKTDAAGRLFEPCGHWSGQKKPNSHPITCNRVAGHEGRHQLIDAHSFGVRAEWD